MERIFFVHFHKNVYTTTISVLRYCCDADVDAVLDVVAKAVDGGTAFNPYLKTLRPLLIPWVYLTLPKQGMKTPYNNDDTSSILKDINVIK